MENSPVAERREEVDRVNGAITTRLSPVPSLSLEFSDDLMTGEIEKTVEDLERDIRLNVPEIEAL